MYCNQCGTSNESESNYCRQCGKPFNTDKYSFKQKVVKADNGFLLISVLLFFPLLLILIWNFFQSKHEVPIPTILEIIPTVSTILIFIILTLFTKNRTYRIIIISIGIVCSVFSILQLIEQLSYLNSTYLPA
jgi:uncharacterized membrane protein YvbJ